MGEQKVTNEKEASSGFKEEIFQDLLNFDRGLPATIKYMIIAPDVVLREYFAKTKRFTNPIRYTIILTALTTIVATYFIDYREMYKYAFEAGAGAKYEVMIEDLSQQAPQVDWALFFERIIQISIALTDKFVQLTYILIFAPSIALFSYLFFKKKKPKYFEHFIMAMYIVSTFSLLIIIYAPFTDAASFGSWWFFLIGAPLLLGYLGWVMYKYFNISGVTEVIKVLLVGVLGYIIYALIIAIIISGGATLWMMLG